MVRKNYFDDIYKIGSLNIIYVFYRDVHPILFLCEDNNRKKYLCQCYECRKVQKWHLVYIAQEQLDNLINGETSVLDVFRDADRIYNIEYTLLREEKRSLISFDEIDAFDLPDEDLYLDEDDKDDYLHFFAQNTNDNFSFPCSVYVNTVQEFHTGKGVFLDSIIWCQESSSVEEMYKNGNYKMKDDDLSVQSALEDEEASQMAMAA